MFCPKCGSEINDKVTVCPKCGHAIRKGAQQEKKSWLSTYLLCWFLGCLGLHRFYTGYIGIGVAQLLTLGGCGIWSLVDFISLSFNKFEDFNNRQLDKYIKPLGMIGFVLVILVILINLSSILVTIMAGMSGVQ